MTDAGNEILRPDLVTMVPHGEIEVAHDMVLPARAVADLALVGLSMQFPARMKALNDAMVSLHNGSFGGFKFSLSPDEASPDMTVKKITNPPFLIDFEAYPNLTARFDVTPKDGFSDSRNITLALASNLIDFASKYPTDGQFFFEATPCPPRPGQEYEKLESVKVPLTDILRVVDLTNLGIDSFDYIGKYDLSITLDHRPEATKGSRKPALQKVSIPLGYPFNKNGDVPQAKVFDGESVFWINGFHAQGASADIERVIDVFSGLLDATQKLKFK